MKHKLSKLQPIPFKRIIPVLVYVLGLTLSANASRYDKVDSFVVKVSFPASTVTEYDSLVAIFNKQFSNEEEKVRAVYFWVTENISYDAKGLFSGNMIFEKVGALKNKRCVCAGYADLLDHAFKKMGLESKYLTGSARLLDGLAQWNPDAWQAGHAWNAVKVHGEWKLIDATWASGYLWGDRFEKKRKDVWFFTPPDIFLLSHFPGNPMFQLTDRVITEAEFYEQPFYLWEFETSGINSISHRRLEITGEPGDEVLLSFGSAKEISHLIISDRDDKVVKTLPVFKKEGKYYCRYLVGSIKRGSYYFGFMYMDENKKCIWRSDHVLGYFLTVSDTQ
ncbi:MAG: hypothetical protein JNM19_10160 [Chitinophagaceae bacterium]|nr:hypothetical protein [Chitinophagaceae bacterium]